MKINLIRHGQTSGNLESRYIGTTDEPLCSAGMKALSRRRYPAHGVLICSPMKRCIQTAQAIYPGVKPMIMHELRECDFGAFEGKNYLELNGDPDYQWKLTVSRRGITGGIPCALLRRIRPGGR